MARKRSRRFKKGVEGLDRSKAYPAHEGLERLKNFPAPKFEESVEVAVRLGIDPKKTDQLVRGSVSLPKGTGKEVKIVVFAEGDKAKEAEEAGADVVGAKDLADRIEQGFTDFDMTIAAPDMMGLVGPLGRVLGPRGLMPSPRAGTVTPDVGKVVSEYKAGKVEFRNDKGGNVHAMVGKMSFDSPKLVENITSFMKFIEGMKPQSVKGAYVKGVAICGTMSPSVRVAS